MGEQVAAGSNGGVAQLGEHLPCKQGVKGSNPSISIVCVQCTSKAKLDGLVQAQRSELYNAPRSEASRSCAGTLYKKFVKPIHKQACDDVFQIPCALYLENRILNKKIKYQRRS